MSDLSLSALCPPPGHFKYTFPEMTKSFDYVSLAFYQHFHWAELHECLMALLDIFNKWKHFRMTENSGRGSLDTVCFFFFLEVTSQISARIKAATREEHRLLVTST